MHPQSRSLSSRVVSHFASLSPVSSRVGSSHFILFRLTSSTHTIYSIVLSFRFLDRPPFSSQPSLGSIHYARGKTCRE